MLHVSKESELLIHAFLTAYGIKRRTIRSRLHLTVYHARRKIPQIESAILECAISVPGVDFRFMTMTPGGENPRPDVDPNTCPVGVRVHKSSQAYIKIQELRAQLIKFETESVLGKRRPSTKTRNAFGSRYYQPHITLLRQGSGVGADLRPLGDAFRRSIEKIEFNSFEIIYREPTGAVS
jgi:hypothetical protein